MLLQGTGEVLCGLPGAGFDSSPSILVDSKPNGQGQLNQGNEKLPTLYASSHFPVGTEMILRLVNGTISNDGKYLFREVSVRGPLVMEAISRRSQNLRWSSHLDTAPPTAKHRPKAKYWHNSSPTYPTLPLSPSLSREVGPDHGNFILPSRPACSGTPDGLVLGGVIRSGPK
ncbi:hypothetical protein AVEN_69761-1 [Araneus ventricosus]|uniref:Uncharacterized protein n=1 Tax=Araneus ventricosus TaxID=182803 RepID=A0A4Y2CWT3_ARAVE|nr:hypothetical protein AVEN_69761-1 [Araneus ventricosus]